MPVLNLLCIAYFLIVVAKSPFNSAFANTVDLFGHKPRSKKNVSKSCVDRIKDGCHL